MRLATPDVHKWFVPILNFVEQVAFMDKFHYGPNPRILQENYLDCRDFAIRPVQNARGVTYSRPNSGTGMPSTERFRARPMWACLEPCPLREITSFELDSSRSRKSVFRFDHIRIFGSFGLKHGQSAIASGIFCRYFVLDKSMQGVCPNCTTRKPCPDGGGIAPP
jgi:hypothetical protein